MLFGVGRWLKEGLPQVLDSLTSTLMLLLALLSLPAWHGPLVLHHHTPACAIGRTWITNTLTTKSNVGIPGGLTNSVAAGPPAIVEDAQATVPRVLQGVNLFAQLNQLWPPLATALAACLLMLRRTGLHRPPLVLTTLLGVEAAHHCYARLRSYARGRSHTRPERSGASQLELWRKCLDEDTTISAADFIRGWFLPSQHKGTEVRLSELRRDNVAEFISYAVHSRRVDELDAVAGAEIERCICMVEERVAAEEAVIGFRFEEGYNDQLSAMTLNLDPPSSTMQPRPLLYYLLTDVLASTVTGAIMHARGFRRYSEGKLSYWHHSGDVAGPSDKMSDRMCRVTHLDVAGASGEATPLVFVHGVGLGLTPYLDFLKRLRELRSSGGHRPPMLVLELPFVSQRLAGLWSLPQEVRTTEEIGRAMARHQMPRATFVGHSLGTVYMSWVAKLRPELLASCVFIDPIVFLLHQRKVRPPAQRFMPCIPHLVCTHSRALTFACSHLRVHA